MKKYLGGFRASFSYLTSHPGYANHRLRSLLRAVWWYALIAVGKNPVRKVKEWSATFVLPASWRTPAKVFYVFDRDYEPEVKLLEEILRPDDVFFDIGANFGLFVLLANAKVGPRGFIHAFEPFAPSFAILKKNCDLNQLKRTQLWPIALGDTSRDATISMHHDPGRNALSSLQSMEIGSATVRVEKLDDLWRSGKLSLERLDVIKMDVEGFEKYVLDGGTEMFSTYTPVVVFELNPDACARAGSSGSAVVRHFENLNYRLYEAHGFTLTEIAQPDSFGNYVAIQPDQMTHPRFARLKFEPLPASV